MNHHCKYSGEKETGGALTICQSCKTDLFENYFGLSQNDEYKCQFCLETMANDEQENVHSSYSEGLKCHKKCWQKFLADGFGYTVYYVKLLIETSHHENYCTDDECEYEAKDNIHLFLTKSDKPLTSQDFVLPKEKYRPNSYFCKNSKISKFKGLDKHQIRYTLAAYRCIYPRDENGFEQDEWIDIEDLDNSVIYDMKNIE
jgi:hypothetical protein